MTHAMKQFAILAPLLTTIIVLSQLIPTIVCKSIVIPADVSKLNQWIYRNIKEFQENKGQLNDATERKSSDLDQVLAAAEVDAEVITVRKDGNGDFTTVTEAVNSIPTGNAKRVVVKIGGGDYQEKITVDRSKNFVTFYGDPNGSTRILFGGTASEYGTYDSATVAVDSDYFVAVNIAFVNSAPMPDSRRNDAQAVAMRISGDKAAFHNCKFIGFQDTLYDDKGRHFFKDCHIEGTVDFIFGNGQSIYLNTTIKSVATGVGVITAQGRERANEESGFAFVNCSITGTGDIYLGRAWKDRARVIFAYTRMDAPINSEGWVDGMYNETNDNKAVYYGEYKCSGPGANSFGRAKFVKKLTDAEVEPFLSMSYLNGNKWILPPPTV